MYLSVDLRWIFYSVCVVLLVSVCVVLLVSVWAWCIDLRWIFYSVCVVLLVLFEHDVSNSCKWLVVCAGVRSHDEIHQSGEPGRVSSPHCSADGHRHVLHRLVLCVSFTIHTWAFSDQKAACKDVWIFASLTPILRYEVTSTKYTRDLYKELLISLVASLFMGFGVLFLLLWVGIYVWKWVSSLSPAVL